MRENHDIEELLRRVEFDDTPNAAHREQLERQVLAAVGTNRTRPARGHTNTWRIIVKNRYAKLATAAAVLLIAGILVSVLGLGNGGASLAWADVYAEVHAAQTVIYTAQSGPTDNVKVAGQNVKAFYKEPGLFRVEKSRSASSKEGHEPLIMIGNASSGQLLHLYPMTKRAVRKEMHVKASDRTSLIDRLFQMIDGADEELGEKTFDGRKLRGFLVTRSSGSIEFWVDPKTRYPVFAKGRKTDGPGKGDAWTAEFIFNADIDDALFSLELPDGYELQNSPDSNGN